MGMGNDPSREIPMEMRTKLLTNGDGMGMRIAHMETGIFNVFSFDHNFPSKICI